MPLKMPVYALIDIVYLFFETLIDTVYLLFKTLFNFF